MSRRQVSFGITQKLVDNHIVELDLEQRNNSDFDNMFESSPDALPGRIPFRVSHLTDRSKDMSLTIYQLTSHDTSLMQELLTVFGQAFDDLETYREKRPSSEYLHKLLANDYFISLVALSGNKIVGGITAYELIKYEQERSEIYLYDLAVKHDHRRLGIATQLIEELKAIAKARGAYLIFVQADTGIDDQPAISLYTKMGLREDVLHFDIGIDSKMET